MPISSELELIAYDAGVTADELRDYLRREIEQRRSSRLYPSESMTEDEQRRREDAARRLWDALAVTTEHKDVTRIQAFREMCETAIKIYDDTDDQYLADWAREALRLLNERR